MRRTVALAAGALAATLVVGAAAVPGSAAAPAKSSRAKAAIVFNGEGNNLNAYSSVPPFKKQRVITNAEDDPKGRDINAQICFFPRERNGKRWFIAGEDTGQPDPPQGWGIFALSGDRVGKLKAKQIGKLTPTYQGSLDNAENYGCGFLRDGRVLTTDIGNQASGDGDGQLIVWFPPFNRTKVRYCKIDVGIATAGNIYVDKQDRVYVPSARPPSSGVWRYTGPFPTSDTPEGGCETTDSTGAPKTDTVTKELFIPSGGEISTPNAIVRSPRGGFYVSSVFNGVIAEVDRDGTFLRTVLKPAPDDELGTEPYATGTPLGLGIDKKGTLYYADIGIVIDDGGVGPGDRTGTVRRIRFVDGEPQAPQTMDRNLAFPDGIGVLNP
jgi:hypothetical protein